MQGIQGDRFSGISLWVKPNKVIRKSTGYKMGHFLKNKAFRGQKPNFREQFFILDQNRPPLGQK